MCPTHNLGPFPECSSFKIPCLTKFPCFLKMCTLQLKFLFLSLFTSLLCTIFPSLPHMHTPPLINIYYSQALVFLCHIDFHTSYRFPVLLSALSLSALPPPPLLFFPRVRCVKVTSANLNSTGLSPLAEHQWSPADTKMHLCVKMGRSPLEDQTGMPTENVAPQMPINSGHMSTRWSQHDGIGVYKR